jgi:hypothetical protein
MSSTPRAWSAQQTKFKQLPTDAHKINYILGPNMENIFALEYFVGSEMIQEIFL